MRNKGRVPEAFGNMLTRLSKEMALVRESDSGE
jgi:hypothetical protein